MRALGRFLTANRRWLAGGFLLTFFSSFGQTFFIALSSEEIRETFALSHGDFGGLYMLATLASALTLPFLGRLLDIYPIVVIAIGTMILLAAAASVLPLAGSIPILLIGLYMLRLFGQGMMTEIALTATGKWFAANRGRAIAITSIGMRVGEGCLPFLFVLVVGALGWHGAWFAAAAVTLFVALPAIALLVRVERDPQAEAAALAMPLVRDWTRGEVLRDPKFYAILIGVLAPPFIGTTIFFHQVYLTELRGWPLHLFTIGFAVLSATNVVVTIVAGWLVDRFSSVRLLPLFLLPLAMACFAAAYLEAEWAIFLFMTLFGMSQGFANTLTGSMWPEVYGTRHLGAIRSVVVASMVLSTAAGPGITGYLIDAGVDFSTQLASMGLYSILAALAMWIVSRRILRQAPVR